LATGKKSSPEASLMTEVERVREIRRTGVRLSGRRSTIRKLKMVDREDTIEPDARTLAELSALADGTLDPERVPAVRALIAASPELSRRYERESRAVGALRAVRSDRAPARVRAGVASQREPSRKARPRLIYGGALAGAVAAVVAALVLLLPGSTPGAPSVSQAAALALRGPAMAAPTADRAHGGTKLKLDVEAIYFPNWSWAGWRAVGQRVDRLGHWLAVTVYYQSGASRIAYTILSAPALHWPGTREQRLHGVEFESFVSGTRRIVTWRRAGHTCVLSGWGLSTKALSQLALSGSRAPR
jgi:hypothetical protein